MSATIAPKAAAIRRGRPTTSHQTAGENTRSATSPPLAVYSKPMLMAGSRNFTLLELMARP